MRIALFVTCLADAMFPDVGRATITVLQRLGHTVEFPPAQTCCGQMHINTGYQRQSLPLVERFAEGPIRDAVAGALERRLADVLGVAA